MSGTPAEELGELQLSDTEWDTVISEVRSRQPVGPDGEAASLRDTVVLVGRR